MNQSPEAAPAQPESDGEFSTSHLFRRYADRRDPEALADLVKRVGPILYIQAKEQIADYMRARFGPEDVAQSVWISFVKKVDDGKFVWQSSRAFLGLLGQMIHTKVLEYVRRHEADIRDAKRNQPLHGPDGLAIDPQAKADHVDAFLTEEVNHVTKLLAEHFKDRPTHLRVLPGIVDKKTPQEIATSLGLTVVRIRQIIRDAEDFVREYSHDQ